MAFGQLKSFHLVKEPNSDKSKGYAFCEYIDLPTTMDAIAGLNNFPIRDKILTVKLASQNITPTLPSTPAGHAALASIYGPGGLSNINNNNNNNAMKSIGYYGPNSSTEFSNQTPTRVIILLLFTIIISYSFLYFRLIFLIYQILILKNLVDQTEIQDDNEHLDIQDDVKSECSQHGSVRSVLIPRLKDGFPAASEGSVFVEFNEAESATRAAQSLRGRKFADRMVIVNYVSN